MSLYAVRILTFKRLPNSKKKIPHPLKAALSLKWVSGLLPGPWMDGLYQPYLSAWHQQLIFKYMCAFSFLISVS